MNTKRIAMKSCAMMLGLIVLSILFVPGCGENLDDPGSAAIETTADIQETAVLPDDQAEEIKDAELPAFTVSDLKILKEVVKPRESSGASVVVTNNSGQTGTFTVELRIDGVVTDHTDVTLQAKSSETVNFKFSREETGTYSVEIGHLGGQFRVATGILEPESPGSTPSEAVVTLVPSEEEWTIPEGNSDLFRAVHMGGNWGTNTAAVNDPPEEYFEYLRDLNVNWVGISTAIHVSGSDDSTVEFDYNVPQASWDDTVFRNLVKAFKRHGFHLYVHVAFENTLSGEHGFDRWQMGDPFMHAEDPDIDPEYWLWRTDHPQYEQFVAEFWQTYTDCLTHIAGICEDEGVEMMTLGTETDRLFRSRTGGRWPNNFLEEMQTMVSAVRNVYSGQLSYEMLHFSLEDRALFGPSSEFLYQDLDLDFLALSAYFKLSETAQNRVMGVQELETAWERIFTDHLIPWQQRNPGKRIVLSEFGYTDTTECPWDPSARQFVNRIDEDRDENGLDDGEEAQRNCMEAFFNVMENHPGVVDGAFIWGVQMATQAEYERSFGQMRTFNIREKLAEVMVKERYGAWLNR